MRRLRTITEDVRFALHGLTRSPARLRYALTAVLTLGLGVGGTAAVHGIAQGLLFKGLPYAREGELGVFWKKTDWNEEEFLFLRGQAPGFRQVALYRLRDMILGEVDAPARLIAGVTASSELFELLGAQPLIGHGFRPGDDVPGAERTAVLSHGLWQALGGRPSIVGTRLRIDGVQRTVVGVMPRGFWFPDPSVNLWTIEQLSADSRSWNSTLIGRVASGYDVRAMDASVARLTAMLGERFQYPEQWDKTRGARITPLRDDLLGGMRLPIMATLGTMALILAIACTNVAALMLGQVDGRSREMALRAALGASRGRLAQLLVAEATVIAVAAGAFGAGVAWVGFRVLARGLPLDAWTDAVAPNWSVFVSAMIISIAGALLTVLIPMLVLWRREPSLRSRIALRGGHTESRLVVAQVAFAVLIASGTALLARSVINLNAIRPGVRTDGVVVLDVMMSGGRQSRAATLDQLMAELAGLPGVREAAAVQMLPLRGGGYNLGANIEGRPELQRMSTEYRTVTPGYLELMGLPLRDGRTIAEGDREGTERVVVINEAFAKEYFPGVNPIGQQVGGDIGTVARVVGVVANAAERHLTDAAVPVRYVPLAQMPWIDDAQSIVLSTALAVDPGATLDAARQIVHRIAPSAAIRGQTTMSRVFDNAVGPVRQVMSLLALLTAIALTLGAVGVYGVIAHFAARRQREWAIRIALGVTGARVVARVLGYGALLVATGIAIGIVLAAALARVLSSFFYGVGALDPIALASASTLLLGVGLLASVIPAWRAGTTDPAITLRES